MSSKNLSRFFHHEKEISINVKQQIGNMDALHQRLVKKDITVPQLKFTLIRIYQSFTQLLVHYSFHLKKTRELQSLSEFLNNLIKKTTLAMTSEKHHPGKEKDHLARFMLDLSEVSKLNYSQYFSNDDSDIKMKNLFIKLNNLTTDSIIYSFNRGINIQYAVCNLKTLSELNSDNEEIKSPHYRPIR